MVELSIGIVDEAGSKTDWYSGLAAECPPLPRLGDLVGCGGKLGTVHRIEHGVSESETIGGSGPDESHKRYAILIRTQTRPVV
jgi:hypothetical protein